MKKTGIFSSLLLFVISYFSSMVVSGQLSITALNTPVIQNFDALVNTGTGTQSAGIFAQGWSFLESGTGQDQSYQAGTGSSATGDTYSFGLSGVNALSDRGFGMLQSGSLTSIIGFRFTNNTGKTVSSLKVGFTGEVWRLSTAADNLSFSYQSGNVALNAPVGWVNLASLNFTTPVTGTTGAVDGNNSGNRTVIAPVTIYGLYIPDGATVTFRWVDVTGTSSAGMCIDDFSLQLIPASSAYFRTRTTGNWNAITTWETSADGATWAPATTSVPTDLASRITILSGHTVTVTADLTVSKIAVQPGGRVIYTGGSLTVTDFPDIDVVLQGTNSVFEMAAPTNPVLIGNAGFRIGPGALLQLSGNSNLLNYHNSAYTYAHGATFEYTNTGAPSLTGTLFTAQDAGAIPTFLYNSVNTTNLGGAGATTINGKVEIAAARTLNLNGVAGTLTIRNGITGAGVLRASATVMFTGPSAELGGAGIVDSHVTINSGCTASVTSNKTFTSNNVISTSGTLDVGNWQLQTLSGTASLTVNATGTVKTANAAGLVNSTGSLKTGSFTVNFAPGSTIDYNRNGAQVISISGLPAYQNLIISGTGTKTAQSGANLIIQRSCVISANATMALTGAASENLYLNNNAALQVLEGGTFDNGGESSITTSGGSPSVSIAGRFITRSQQGFTGVNAPIPSIVPFLEAASIVEYGRSGDQTVQANLTYGHLTFSGSGTKTPTNAISLNGTVTITGAVILNGAAHTIGGVSNNLVMSGTSRFVVGGTGTRPAIGGVYTLAPSTTIEFSNTNTTVCIIRQGGPAIQYANVEITGTNIAAPASGITLQNGAIFTVKNNAVFKTSSVNGLYAASNAAILSSNNPLLTLQSGSTIEYNGADQALTTGFIYSNLTLSGSGIKAASGAFTVAQTLTRSGSASLGGTSPAYLANATLAYVDATSGRNYITGLEWPSANAPANLVINVSGGGVSAVVLNSDKAVSGGVTLVAGTLNLNDKTMSSTGNISGNGSFTGSGASSMVINGGNALLYFTQTTDGASNALARLTVNSGTVTLGNRLNLYDVLDVAGGTLNLNNQSFVLKSLVSQTARVAELKGTLTGGTNVWVERSVSNVHNRRWRLVTSPVSGTSINASWQEGRRWNGVAAETGTGFGTLITGQQQGTALAANTNGFDFWPAIAGASSSLRRYQGAANRAAASWQPVQNTTAAGAFDNHEAYLLFVRGDRSVSAAGGGGTVLRARGILKEANSYLVQVLNQSHTLIGNPFASPLNFKRIYDDNRGKIREYFWTWQASLGATGGYVVVRPTGNGEYEKVPDNSPSGTAVNPVIGSGEGFFVVPATTSLPTPIEIRQTHKTNGNPMQQVLRQAGAGVPARLRVNVLSELDGVKTLLDGALLLYGPSDSTIKEDIQKAINPAENLSLQKSGISMVVSNLEQPRTTDTVQLRLWNTVKKNYSFEIWSAGFTASGISAVLVDSYLQKEIPLNLQNSSTTYSFNIDSQLGSGDQQRFYIILRTMALTPKPATVTRLVALEKTGYVQVEWTVEEERNVWQYHVEKSANGHDFSILTSVTARSGTGQQNYQSIDTFPLAVAYYRIKMVGRGGEATYSTTVKVLLQSPERAVQVFPNPVTNGSVNLLFVNKPRGTYKLSLYNAQGNQVWQKRVQHAGGTAIYNLSLASTLASATYTLDVRFPGHATTVPLLVIR